jgi:hypothetical protein
MTSSTNLAAAIEALDHVLKRGTDVLDLTVTYTKGNDAHEFVLLVSEEVACDDVLGAPGPEISTIAFAESATLAEGIVLLAQRMATAGYGAVRP